MKRLFIGIDPSGAKTGNNGCCAAFSKTEILEINVTDFFGFMAWVDMVISKYHIPELMKQPVAVVEDTNKQEAGFNRGLYGRRRDRQMRNLGMNQLASRLCIEYLKMAGFDVISRSPQEKGRKLTEQQFRAISKYTGKLRKKDEHAMDGYKLLLPFFNMQ